LGGERLRPLNGRYLEGKETKKWNRLAARSPPKVQGKGNAVDDREAPPTNTLKITNAKKQSSPVGRRVCREKKKTNRRGRNIVSQEKAPIVDSRSVKAVSCVMAAKGKNEIKEYAENGNYKKKQEKNSVRES